MPHPLHPVRAGPRRLPRTVWALLPLSALLIAPARSASSEPDLRRLAPKERARIELGRRLFFDPVVSRSGARACASCHDPEHGFSDRLPVSVDDVGLTRRHSQPLQDSALNPTAHWDGEFLSLEALITARLKPVSSAKGLSSHGAALGADGGVDARRPAPTPPPPQPGPPATAGGAGSGGGGEPYATRAPDADAKPPEGGAPPPPAAPPGAAPAPAPAPAPGAAPAQPAPAPLPVVDLALEHDQQVPLDVRLLPRVDATLEQAARYREAFQAAYGSPEVNIDRIAGAIAAYCRSLVSTRSPFDRFLAGESSALTEQQRHGLELFEGAGRCATCHSVTPGPDGRAPLSDYRFHDTGVAWRAFARGCAVQTRRGALLEPDAGREKVTTSRTDRRAFKTPSLRDVARRGPYFHDGSAPTLKDAVSYYVAGGSPDPARSAHVAPFAASDADVAALVAFLEALSGAERPGLATEAWSRRAEQAELTFVDGAGRRLAGFPVSVTAAGDRLPGFTAEQDAPQRLLTDEKGVLRFTPPLRTHVRLGLPEGLMPVGGDLLPDTCAKARVVVPVDGRMRLVLEGPAARALPGELWAEHLGTMRLPGQPAAATLFTQVGSLPVADGRRITVYTGWRRTDVPPEVRLNVPPSAGARVPRPKAVLDGELVTVALDAPAVP